MTIDSRQLERHRRSFEKHYFTNGVDITLTKYAYTTDKYGDSILGVSATSSFKGFILSNKDAEQLSISQISIPNNALSIIAPYDKVVYDNSTNELKLTINSVNYKVYREETVGKINNFSGYYKLLLLTEDL